MGLKRAHFREDYGATSYFGLGSRCPRRCQSRFLIYVMHMSIIKPSIKPKGTNTKMKTQMLSKLQRGAVLGCYNI